MKMFNKVILGGTFDLLHTGHQKLLNQAFSVANFIRIGLTTDHFNQTRGKKTYQSQEIREKKLQAFLEQHFSRRYKIHLISDVLGDAENDAELEAIIVTSETESNAKLVNQERSQKSYSLLEIIIVEPEKDELNQVISSTRIRNGEINQQGQIYEILLKQIENKQLSDEVKNQFKQPFGKLLEKIPINKNSKIITVGDITTQQFIKHHIIPDLAIVDLKTKREKQFQDISELGLTNEGLTVTNSPGEISSDLVQAIKQSNNSVILVEGEEDLATIPAVLLSPLGTKIYYGQPDQGIVEVEVIPEIKSQLLFKLNIS